MSTPEKRGSVSDAASFFTEKAKEASSPDKASGVTDDTPTRQRAPSALASRMGMFNQKSAREQKLEEAIKQREMAEQRRIRAEEKAESFAKKQAELQKMEEEGKIIALQQQEEELAQRKKAQEERYNFFTTNLSS